MESMVEEGAYPFRPFIRQKFVNGIAQAQRKQALCQVETGACVWQRASVTAAPCVRDVVFRGAAARLRISSKGQVTIPQELRARTGLLPGVEVEFVQDKNGFGSARRTVLAG